MKCTDQTLVGECWKDVPGYAGRYQASDEGRVRLVREDGSMRILVPFIHTHRHGITNKHTLVVRLVKPDGRRKEASLLRTIAETWIGVPPGLVPYHKNGMFRENEVWNIGFCTQTELGTKFGRLSRRARGVYKIDRAGNILDMYPSARIAAKKNYMSYQSVMDRCNGKTKKPFRVDGTSFAWTDSKRGRKKL